MVIQLLLRLVSQQVTLAFPPAFEQSQQLVAQESKLVVQESKLVRQESKQVMELHLLLGCSVEFSSRANPITLG